MGGGCSAVQAIMDKDTMIPGVHLPADNILSKTETLGLLVDLKVASSVEIVRFLQKQKDATHGIAGKPVSDTGAFSKLHSEFADFNAKEHQLPDDYQFFGNGDSEKIVTTFLKTNPFFTSAIVTTVEDGSTKFVVNSTGPENTYFQRLVAALDKKKHVRIKAVFNTSFQLESIKSTLDGAKVERTRQQACNELLFLFTYYAESVHALIHVFQLLLVSAMVDSADDYGDMDTWSAPYAPSIYLKFSEVRLLLLSEKGVLVEGVSASRPVLLSTLRDIIVEWGSFKTANEFVTKFLFSGSKQDSSALVAAGALTEFQKHTALIAGFADDLTAEFAKDADKYKDVNKKLAHFLSNTGDDVIQVRDTKEWIHLMSVTGLFHGTTMSMTRLLMTAPIVALFRNEANFSNADAKLAFTAALTITGVVSDRHVFSSSIQRSGLIMSVRNILKKYDDLSSALKVQYANALRKDPEFSQLGWILSDYGPDGFDGKQLTITTYV